MSTDPEIWPVGHTFTDSDGRLRVKTPFGFNAFVTQESAIAAALSLGRNGSTWYVWRLSDGSFMHTAVPEPATPGHPADLMDAFVISGYGKRKRAIPADYTGQEGGEG